MLNRIGMWGHSMGGYITLRAMVTDPSIKAGVIWAGVVASYPDLVERWNRSVPAVRCRTGRPRAGARSCSTNTARLRRIQTIGLRSRPTAISRICQAPCRFTTAPTTPRCRSSFRVKLFDQIKAAGETAEIYTYLGDDHNISQSLTTAIQRSVAFFDRYVKNASE